MGAQNVQEKPSRCRLAFAANVDRRFRDLVQVVPVYKTILIPLENSPTDQAIVDHIRPLARILGSRLILIHVADGFAARHQSTLNLAESEEMRDDRVYLEQRRDELAREGLRVEAELACGDPTDEILKVAERERCDLIAMSTHGHRIVKDIVLGSVASAVRHRTDIPVLLVRASVNNGANQ